MWRKKQEKVDYENEIIYREKENKKIRNYLWRGVCFEKDEFEKCFLF